MRHILCFGDSNTWGYDIETYDPIAETVQRMPFEVRWPGALQGLLGSGYRIIEEALNARTLLQEDPYFPLRQGLNALRVAADSHAPLDVVILHLGVNELKHMFCLSAGMIALGMEKLVDAARGTFYGYPPPKILVVAPPPVLEEIAQAAFGFSFGPEAAAKSRQLGPLYCDLAARRGCAFLDAGTLGMTLNPIDCLHYNRDDHRKLAKALAEAIEKLCGPDE